MARKKISDKISESKQKISGLSDYIKRLQRKPVTQLMKDLFEPGTDYTPH